MSYTSLQTEDAVYWPPGQPDGFGQTVPEDAVELKVRWQDDQRRRVDATGVEFISQAIVYCNQQLAYNGWLWYGKLEDAEYPSAPRKQLGAYQIKAIERSQNPSGLIVVYKHILGGGS